MKYMWQCLYLFVFWLTGSPGAQGELFKGAALFAPMLSLERASHHGLNYYLRFVALLPVLRGFSTYLARADPTGLHVTLLLRVHDPELMLFVLMLCLMYRPLAALLSWIWPTLPAASTTKNHLYPELQALWDQGTIDELLLFT